MIKTSIDLFDETCNAVSRGELDKQLLPLKKLIDERLSVVRADTDIEDFVVGDKIVLNDKCGIKSMIGEEGVVVEIRRTKISITLNKPKGRFARTNSKGEIYSANAVVPISIVDKI
jgi:hypothetical protein